MRRAVTTVPADTSAAHEEAVLLHVLAPRAVCAPTAPLSATPAHSHWVRRDQEVVAVHWGLLLPRPRVAGGLLTATRRQLSVRSHRFRCFGRTCRRAAVADSDACVLGWGGRALTAAERPCAAQLHRHSRLLRGCDTPLVVFPVAVNALRRLGAARGRVVVQLNGRVPASIVVWPAYDGRVRRDRARQRAAVPVCGVMCCSTCWPMCAQQHSVVAVQIPRVCEVCNAARGRRPDTVHRLVAHAVGHRTACRAQAVLHRRLAHAPHGLAETDVQPRHGDLRHHSL